MIEWFSALSSPSQAFILAAVLLWLPVGWISVLFWSKVQSGEWTPLDLCQAERPTWRVFLFAYLGPFPLAIGAIFLGLLWAEYYLTATKESHRAGRCRTN